MASKFSSETRELDMCRRYRDGETLQSIGYRHGVTRERVRQLIKPYGFTGANGGVHVLAERKRTAKNAELSIRRDRRVMGVYGCSYDEVRRINLGMALTDVGSPAYAFVRDICNARRRGIKFELTLPQWIGLYELAGGVWNRGRVFDGLVLGRIDKSGDYTINNVRVVTLAENSRDARMQRCHGTTRMAPDGGKQIAGNVSSHGAVASRKASTPTSTRVKGKKGEAAHG